LTLNAGRIKGSTLPHLIPQSAIEKYSRCPSNTTITTARLLQEQLRDLLGNGYETFLQGSYKNDTATRDLDDVDIVAIRKQTFSGSFGTHAASLPQISWDSIFSAVEQTIRAHPNFTLSVTRGDKCVKVESSLNVDIVPAVVVTTFEDDPIAIYSWRGGRERPNSPRIHYANNVEKHQRTGERYKPVVRMLKTWARNHFGESQEIAPSFYLECLVYNVPDSYFLPDTAERFYRTLSFGVSLSYSNHRILTVAGEKDVLQENEWSSQNFAAFQSRLADSYRHVQSALNASTQVLALKYWQMAFNE
jgi:hypothetical protein